MDWIPILIVKPRHQVLEYAGSPVATVRAYPQPEHVRAALSPDKGSRLFYRHRRSIECSCHLRDTVLQTGKLASIDIPGEAKCYVKVFGAYPAGLYVWKPPLQLLDVA